MAGYYLHPLVSFVRPMVLSKFKGYSYGGAEDGDFTIPHMSISMKHCIFVVKKEGFQILDLKSDCGTFVNGKKINPYLSVRVKENDIIGMATDKIQNVRHDSPYVYRVIKLQSPKEEELGIKKRNADDFSELLNKKIKIKEDDDCNPINPTDNAGSQKKSPEINKNLNWDIGLVKEDEETDNEETDIDEYLHENNEDTSHNPTFNNITVIEPVASTLCEPIVDNPSDTIDKRIEPQGEKGKNKLSLPLKEVRIHLECCMKKLEDLKNKNKNTLEDANQEIVPPAMNQELHSGKIDSSESHESTSEETKFSSPTTSTSTSPTSSTSFISSSTISTSSIIDKNIANKKTKDSSENLSNNSVTENEEKLISINNDEQLNSQDLNSTSASQKKTYKLVSSEDLYQSKQKVKTISNKNQSTKSTLSVADNKSRKSLNETSKTKSLLENKDRKKEQDNKSSSSRGKSYSSERRRKSSSRTRSTRTRDQSNIHPFSSSHVARRSSNSKYYKSSRESSRDRIRRGSRGRRREDERKKYKSSSRRRSHEEFKSTSRKVDDLRSRNEANKHRTDKRRFRIKSGVARCTPTSQDNFATGDLMHKKNIHEVVELRNIAPADSTFENRAEVTRKADTPLSSSSDMDIVNSDKSSEDGSEIFDNLWTMQPKSYLPQYYMQAYNSSSVSSTNNQNQQPKEIEPLDNHSGESTYQQEALTKYNKISSGNVAAEQVFSHPSISASNSDSGSSYNDPRELYGSLEVDFANEHPPIRSQWKEDDLRSLEDSDYEAILNIEIDTDLDVSLIEDDANSAPKTAVEDPDVVLPSIPKDTLINLV